MRPACGSVDHDCMNRYLAISYGAVSYQLFLGVRLRLPR
jgi:hypothetical protein